MRIKRTHTTYIEVQPQPVVQPPSLLKRVCEKVQRVCSACFKVAISAPVLRVISSSCLFAIAPVDFSAAWFLAHVAVAGCDEWMRRGEENVRKEVLKVAIPSLIGAPLALMNGMAPKLAPPFPVSRYCTAPRMLSYNESVALGIGVSLGVVALIREKMQRETAYIRSLIHSPYAKGADEQADLSNLN
jgi:hypothetical protein